MNIQVARITKLYFKVDEENHSVAYAKKCESISYNNSSAELTAKNFKALICVDKTLDQIKADLIRHLSTTLNINGENLRDWSFDFLVQDTNEGFWIDGYGGCSYYCVIKSFLDGQ